MGVNVKAVLGSVAVCGVLLIAGCSSGATASAPSVATSAAVPDMSSAAPAASAPVSSAPAEGSAEQVVAKWACTKDGEEVTCVCEGTEADCKSTVAEPSKVKGMTEKGTVTWFNDKKGYGFILRSTGEDVFVHFSAIQMDGVRTLNPDQCVTFEVKKGPKGLQAESVRAAYDC